MKQYLGCRLARRTRSLQSYCSARPAFNAGRLALAWMALVLTLLAAPGPGIAGSGSGPLVLALGDSLTAGYGLPPDESFPVQLESALRRVGVMAQVVNGGVSGDTSAGGAARVNWLLADQPDLVIVELGANDGLRGLDPAVTRENLERIITSVRGAGAHVLLTGMKAPPNMGQEYTQRFEAVFVDLAQQYGTAFYPFFLEGVAAKPALNQLDGIHPNADGVAIIVENMLPAVMAALAEADR